MLSETTGSLKDSLRHGDGWGRPLAPPPARSSSPPWGLLGTGLVVVGLGVIAWTYLGPDLRRYLKMSNM